MATVDALLAALEAQLGPDGGIPALLEGGITNRNLRVRFAAGEAVVRLPGKETAISELDLAGCAEEHLGRGEAALADPHVGRWLKDARG